MKWGWVNLVDKVSQTCRCSWDDVWRMTALEFLNIVSYYKDKTAEEQRALEEFKKNN